MEELSTGDQRLKSMEELSTGDQRLKWLCWWPPSRPPSRRPVEVDIESVQFFDLLKAATNNFSPENELGRGGWGTVYKGQTRDGFEVAIKIFRGYASVTNLDLQFETLPNFDSQLGKRILVYEYMANGSLDKFIFDQGRGVSLDWSSRFQIIEGIAQGLLHLHTHTDGHIVHRDLKPSNILLDFGLNAKIGDFGIATMFSPGQHEDRNSIINGTNGYLAPECTVQRILSTKVDVFAFGVVLLEIISSKRCLSFIEEGLTLLLEEHAWHLWITRRSFQLIDPSLRHEARRTEIKRCIQIALLCVQTDPADRPTMSDVLVMLSSESIRLPAPKGTDYYL